MDVTLLYVQQNDELRMCETIAFLKHDLLEEVKMHSIIVVFKPVYRRKSLIDRLKDHNNNNTMSLADLTVITSQYVNWSLRWLDELEHRHESGMCDCFRISTTTTKFCKSF